LDELSKTTIDVLQKRVGNLQAVARSVRKDSEKKIAKLEADCFRLRQSADQVVSQRDILEAANAKLKQTLKQAESRVKVLEGQVEQ